MADLDLGRVAVKASDKKRKHDMIPVDRLIRYNFLEVFIRLSEQKFIKSGLFNKFDMAIDALFDMYLIESFEQYDSHIWRKKYLWKEECDLTIKRMYRTF